ncbi:MAG: sulfatase-like hydrolase/transferase [Caldilineae bacterium]|nr:sulfatase-like hydrolase/transferase [Anaerolineae bacterium]MCB0252637.1 sulfatase-like hydrolase/transferase [Anaerolineae bacterium]MCB9153762.1 sulfatase-like hydrolase/transferase [Caldilineae bacterium]
MTQVVVLFLDGVGLGSDDPAVNPLAAAEIPVLIELLDGARPLQSVGRVSGSQASLVPTDATLGVAGKPQSASGQAALVTGLNVPQMIGGHYGPRPNKQIRAILEGTTLFSQALAGGASVAFANAYPQGYFDAVQRGKRLHGAIPHAVQAAGIRLRTADDLRARQALSVDLTNAGWRNGLGYANIPLWTAQEAGGLLGDLAVGHDLTFFDNWATDMVGHHNDMAEALHLLADLDQFLAGLLATVDLDETLIIITSDHGNLEDTSVRGHTLNPVATVVIGAGQQAVAEQISSLTDITPALLAILKAG